MFASLASHAGHGKGVLQQAPQVDVMQALGRRGFGEGGAAVRVLDEQGVQKATDPGIRDAMDKAIQLLKHLLYRALGCGEEVGEIPYLRISCKANLVDPDLFSALEFLHFAFHLHEDIGHQGGEFSLHSLEIP